MTLIHIRHPYTPENVTDLVPGMRLCWNKKSAWLSLAADASMLEDEIFWGPLLNEDEARDVAALLMEVSEQMAPSNRVGKSFVYQPGRSIWVDEPCEGLASAGIVRNDAVLNDGWFRTFAQPLHRDQVRALARKFRTFAIKMETAQ